jgi:hypothetical protein
MNHNIISIDVKFDGFFFLKKKFCVLIFKSCRVRIFSRIWISKN